MHPIWKFGTSYLKRQNPVGRVRAALKEGQGSDSELSAA